MKIDVAVVIPLKYSIILATIPICKLENNFFLLAGFYMTNTVIHIMTDNENYHFSTDSVEKYSSLNLYFEKKKLLNLYKTSFNGKRKVSYIKFGVSFIK